MPIATDAWHVEMLAGRGVSRETWDSAAFVDVVGAERPLARGFAIAPMFSLGAMTGFGSLGARDDRTVWIAAGGARVALWRGFFASFELGAVNHRTPTFSSDYQFATSLGWGRGHFRVSLRHVSNGSTQGENWGSTMLLAGAAF